MLLTLLTFALLASGITANKVILFAMSPSLLVAIRMLVASIILFIYLQFFSKNKLNWSSIQKNLATLLVITICTTFLPTILKAEALQELPSSKVAFLGSLDPFITAIYGYFFFSEKLNIYKVLGLLIAFTGIMFLIIPSLFSQAGSIWITSVSELKVVLAIAISRFGWTWVQHHLKRGVFTPTQINTIIMFISGVISVAIAVYFGQTAIKSFADAPFSILHNTPFIYLSSGAILLLFLAYTITFGNLIAYNLYAQVLKVHSATFVSLVGFSVPIFVHFYGWLFLSERLSFNFFISCAITFTGLLIFFFNELKSKRT